MQPFNSVSYEDQKKTLSSYIFHVLELPLSNWKYSTINTINCMNEFSTVNCRHDFNLEWHWEFKFPQVHIAFLNTTFIFCRDACGQNLLVEQMTQLLIPRLVFFDLVWLVLLEVTLQWIPWNLRSFSLQLSSNKEGIFLIYLFCQRVVAFNLKLTEVQSPCLFYHFHTSCTTPYLKLQWSIPFETFSPGMPLRGLWKQVLLEDCCHTASHNPAW